MAAIEEVIFPALSLVFLLLGVVLVASIMFSAFNPYDQMAFANAEKLRAAMDETCVKGGQEVHLSKFDLLQNTPPNWANALFTILPRWLIKSGGDPNYVLYYESFPAGEATGWEVYHNFENRLILPLPEGYDEKSGNDVSAYVKQVVENYRDKTRDSTTISAVVINNIILSEGFRPDYIYGKASGFSDASLGVANDLVGGPAPEKKTQTEKFLGYGKWKNQDEQTKMSAGGDNVFAFSNYMSLTDIEKASIKYASCGANSLCLKTRSGVYTFPLRYCKDIRGVQLAYYGVGDREGILKTLGVDKEGAITLAVIKAFTKLGLGAAIRVTALSSIATEVFTRHIAFKISDFNMVSPCMIESDQDMGITVKETGCGKSDFSSPYLRGSDYTMCSNLIRYPIYQYDAGSGKLNQLTKVVNGQEADVYHYECVDSIGDKIDELPDEQFVGNDKCIQIIVTKVKKNYCWTPNAYKKSDSFWRDNIRSIINAANEIFFDPPIGHNTGYFSDAQAVVLKPTQTALQDGMGLTEALDRKWGWGWP